eukprot:scaffold682651_cov92-Prasinocladus_malaysianus.AAC.1
MATPKPETPRSLAISCHTDLEDSIGNVEDKLRPGQDESQLDRVEVVHAVLRCSEVSLSDLTEITALRTDKTQTQSAPLTVRRRRVSSRWTAAPPRMPTSKPPASNDHTKYAFLQHQSNGYNK